MRSSLFATLLFDNICIIFLHLSTIVIGDNITDWQCGSDGVSKWMSEVTIDADCPNLKNNVNQCCIVHDDCYVRQEGRNNCDDRFCACLHNATKSNTICHQENAVSFCQMVREFGQSAYEDATGVFNSFNRTSLIDDDDNRNNQTVYTNSSSSLKPKKGS